MYPANGYRKQLKLVPKCKKNCHLSVQVLSLQVLRDHSTEEPQDCALTNNMENQSNPSEHWMKGKKIRKYRVGETMNTLRSWFKLQKLQRGLNHAMQSSQEGREPWGAKRGAQRATTPRDDRAQLCDAESWARSYRHRQGLVREAQPRGRERPYQNWLKK